MKYSVLLDSKYGNFIVNRHDVYYPKYLLETDGPPAAHQVDFLLDIVRQIETEPVILDIGAHIGHFSIPLGKDIKKRNGIVHSFEIQRLIFNMLAGNIALNNLVNVFCHRTAIDKECRQLNLPPIDYFSSNNFGGYTLTNKELGIESIEAVSIDSLKLSKLDVIKIDIEGLEENAIIGADQTIREYHPVMFIEYNLSSPNLLERIKEYGYLVYNYDGANCFCIHKSSQIQHKLFQLI